MPHTIFRVPIGFGMVTTIMAGIAVAAPPQPPITSAPPAQIRVTIDVINGFSSRLLCLTPSEHGTALVPPAMVPRRTCRSERDWAARHVLFADE